MPDQQHHSRVNHDRQRLLPTWRSAIPSADHPYGDAVNSVAIGVIRSRPPLVKYTHHGGWASSAAYSASVMVAAERLADPDLFVDQRLSPDAGAQERHPRKCPSRQDDQPCGHPCWLCDQLNHSGPRARHHARDPPYHPVPPSKRIRYLGPVEFRPTKSKHCKRWTFGHSPNRFNPSRAVLASSEFSRLEILFYVTQNSPVCVGRFVLACPSTTSAQGLESRSGAERPRLGRLSRWQTMPPRSRGTRREWCLGPLFNISIGFGRSSAVPDDPPIETEVAERLSATLVAIGAPPVGPSVLPPGTAGR